MPVEVTDRYVRIRVRSPTAFKKGSFRTQDIGRKGHTKRVSGILRRSGKWATQTYLINKQDIKKRDPKALATVDRIIQKHGNKLAVAKALKKVM